MKITTYEQLFIGTHNPFTVSAALLPAGVTATDLHSYMITIYGQTPVFDNAQMVQGMITSIITANADKYGRIAAANSAVISPVGAVDITNAKTKIGMDTHATAHTGQNVHSIGRSGTDTTVNNDTVTDQSNTYDSATLRDTAKSTSNGGSKITYGNTTTDTETRGTTDTLTDTYGTTETNHKIGVDGNQAENLALYLDAVKFSLLTVIIDDVLPAISTGVYRTLFDFD